MPLAIGRGAFIVRAQGNAQQIIVSRSADASAAAAIRLNQGAVDEPDSYQRQVVTSGKLKEKWESSRTMIWPAEGHVII
jgi:hypothetical protein